ncbi:MAG TPA: creatininase family protein [Planctomycetota bacterium]|jgi:creatinine amidohydrolase
MKDWMLTDQNHEFVRSKTWEVAVLPCGATEPHNMHLPYGTDVLEIQTLGDKACEYAYRKGANVICLPTMPFGVNTNTLGVPGGLACSVNPSTLYKVIGDIVDSMERQGVRKILLLNGHGGNEIKPALRELHNHTQAFLCMCDFWRMAPDKDKELFVSPGDHGGEMETSLGLAFFPELVKMEQADKGLVRKTRFDAINKGWVSITRPWHLATTNTGMGDPAAATAEKGRAYMDTLVERLGDFLVQLAAAKIDKRFPY